MAKFEGSWNYRSFNHSVEGKADSLCLEVAPWAPPGQLVVRTSDAGDVTGTLTFKPGVVLAIVGSVIPEASAPGLAAPGGIRLYGEGLGAKYELRGIFTDERQIVGVTLCWRGDLAKLPSGTVGPFVLVKAE